MPGLGLSSHRELPVPRGWTEPRRTLGPAGIPGAQGGHHHTNPSWHSRGAGMPGRVWTPNASTSLLLKGLAGVPSGPQARVRGTQRFTPQLDPSHVLTLVLADHSHTR